jgi:hypothetical protein
MNKIQRVVYDETRGRGFGTRKFIRCYEKNLVHTATSECKNNFNIILWPTLDFPNDIFPYEISTKTLYAFLVSLCVLHSLSIWSSFIWLLYTSYAATDCSFLQVPANSSLSGPNVLLNKFANTFSLNCRDKVSQPYKTRDKIIVFSIQAAHDTVWSGW